MADATLTRSGTAIAGPRAATALRLETVVAAVMGVGTAVSVYPNGGVTATHCVSLLFLPALLSAARGMPHTRWVFGLIGLWVGAVGFTMVLVGDTAKHFAYSLAQPVTLGVSFLCGVWLFRQDRRTVRAFLAALALGLCASVTLYRTPGFAEDPWKYAFGPVVTAGMVLWSALLIRRVSLLVALLPVVAAGMVSLLTGFRAEFGVVVVAIGVTALCTRRAAARRTGSRRRIVLACGVLAVLAVGLSQAYNELAADGTLGEEQRHRWVMQSDIEGGLIVGARPELVSSIELIADSPLLGRGVAPEVDSATAMAFLQRMSEFGVPVDESKVEYYFGHGLYLHSQLFQLWAEMGPLAVPGMVLPIVLVVVAALAAVRTASRPHVLVFVFLACHFGWDLLFSPTHRLQGTYLGTAAAAAVVYLATLRKGTPTDHEHADGHGGAHTRGAP